MLELVDHRGRVWAVEAFQNCRRAGRWLFRCAYIVLDSYQVAINGRLGCIYEGNQIRFASVSLNGRTSISSFVRVA